MFIGEEKLGNNEMDFESKSCENQNAGNYSSPKHATRHAKGQCENGSAESDPAMDMSGAVVNGGLVNWNKTVVEMDVEKVLEEQDTHDLYCPNCNSCITKRVILRKRKRTLQDPQVDSKSEKTQLLLQPHMEASPDTTVANDPSHDTEPDVFRCLSCFNFFIPTGKFVSQTHLISAIFMSYWSVILISCFLRLSKFLAGDSITIFSI